MTKLNVTRNVQLTCSVKGCTNVEDGMFLDRHHVRSQKLWVKVFAHRKSRKYFDFCQRYYEFRPSDIVKLCREHHEEVHDHYWKVIDKHKRKLGLALHNMSWKQANIIMDNLEVEFHKWLARKNSKRVTSLFRKLKPH